MIKVYGMNKGEDIELCKNCPDAPATYEEYCSQYFCPTLIQIVQKIVGLI